MVWRALSLCLLGGNLDIDIIDLEGELEKLPSWQTDKKLTNMFTREK